jgi:hypothetical protein
MSPPGATSNAAGWSVPNDDLRRIVSTRAVLGGRGRSSDDDGRDEQPPTIPVMANPPARTMPHRAASRNRRDRGPGGEAAERRGPGQVAGAAYELKTRIAAVPILALPLARTRGRGEVIGRDTDVVIESFPRCASSFAVAAFRLAQEPRAMHIANHTHTPAQVLVAARRAVPALVLTREPEPAVLSHVIHTPSLTVAGSPRYVRFYEPLLRRREAFVIGTFDEVVNDFGSVIERLNDRFGTSFARFEHTEANLERLRNEIETDYRARAAGEAELERIIPIPSPAREEMKERLRERYRRVPAELRLRAEEIFRRLAPEG